MCSKSVSGINLHYYMYKESLCTCSQAWGQIHEYLYLVIFVNSKMKTRLPVDTLRISDNGEAVSNLDKTNVLNEYFASVFTQEDLRNMPSLPDVFNDYQWQIFRFLITIFMTSYVT